MSFLSYNLQYFKEKIERLERNDLSPAEVYEAKQLLKMLDDLNDEGYFALSNKIRENFDGIERLKNIIIKNGEQPFMINGYPERPKSCFANKTENLNKYIDDLIERSKYADHDRRNLPFLDEIDMFCKWIQPSDDAALVFLLRDALLPYIYYRVENRKNIYAWIISRKFMQLMFNTNIDDIVREIFFDALENDCSDFDSFKTYCKAEIQLKLSDFPQPVYIIKQLLMQIPCKNITVIETGCHGTFPMLLASVDDRIDFKMYSTVPYLKDIYKGRIFTAAYEKLRQFETLYCHDKLFQLSGFKNGEFFVSETKDASALSAALSEIKNFTCSIRKKS